jgi:hypothetical protein
VPTWFGSKAELLDRIRSAHALGLQVYADLVFNHNSGGDAQELNPIDCQSRWTKFDPKSGKFPRDWKCFHASQYETWDGATFGDMPDLCHRTPLVYAELINYARWLLEEIGFDGFRYDIVKGYGGWMVRSIQELRALRGKDYFIWDLAQPNNQSGVDAPIKVHEQSAAGPTQVLYVNDDLYVMQRLGNGDQSGLILVLNNRGTSNGTWVQTRWNNARPRSLARTQ